MDAIEAGADIAELIKVQVKEDIAKAKYIPEDQIEKFAGIRETIDQQISQLKGDKV